MEKPQIHFSGNSEDITGVDLSTGQEVDRLDVIAMELGASATDIENAGGEFVVEPRDESPITDNVVPLRRRR